MSSRPIIRSLQLSVVLGLVSGCATTLPPEIAFAPQPPPTFWTPDSEADPAAWGVYARLVGHKFAPPTSGFPGYEFKWSKPGQEIQEVIAYIHGELVLGDRERSRRVVRLGANGQLISTKDGKDWTGTIEPDGSVYFTRPNDWSYRMRLTSKGELRNEPIDVTPDGKLAAVYDAPAYPVFAGPVLDAITTTANSQPKVAGTGSIQKASTSEQLVHADSLVKPVAVAAAPPPPTLQRPLIGQTGSPGDGEAEYQQGLSFRDGKGVPENNAEAANWFRSAAEKGHPAAQVSLGNLYRDGVGVPKNYGETVMWYRKSADQGYAKGQRSLGYMYDNGFGVAEDDALAAAWYRKAALQNDAPAQLLLGILYENGNGVAQNYHEAEIWYLKASSNGEDNASGYLSNLRWKVDNPGEDEAPPPSGGQVFMNAMNTFAQEYSGAMAEQARNQAHIQQVYAQAQYEQDLRQVEQQRRAQTERRIAQELAQAAEERQMREKVSHDTSQESASSTLEQQQDAVVAAALAKTRQMVKDAGGDPAVEAQLDEVSRLAAEKKQQAGTHKMYASKITLNTTTNSMVPSASAPEPATSESNMAAGKVRLCNRPGDEGPAHWPTCPQGTERSYEPGNSGAKSSSKMSGESVPVGYNSKPSASTDQSEKGDWRKERATAWCMLSKYGNFKCLGPNGKAWSGVKTIAAALSNAGCEGGDGRTPSMGEMNHFDCGRLRQATDGDVPANRPAPW